MNSSPELPPIDPRARAVAYYLPQFHPTAYNDEWWGPGFTEWTNVARARPLFPGHRQPQLPGALGFYDLRLAATRDAQAQLARAHGIEGFCYYHYWFGDGRRVLDQVFADVLASGEPELPFSLCWANQSWSGIWHGAPNRILMEQTYPGDDDIRAHFDVLAPAFHDRRAIRVNGRPLFAVHYPELLPEPERFVELFRTLATQSGLPGIYLVGRTKGHWGPTDHGFDASITAHLVPPFSARGSRQRSARAHPDWWLSRATNSVPWLPGIHSYRKWSPYIPWTLRGTQPSFPTVVPGWDNTPRCGRRGSLYYGSTPELFRDQVGRAIELVDDAAPDERLIFVQAWNEWAEGNCLEPSATSGTAYLEALREALA